MKRLLGLLFGFMLLLAACGLITFQPEDHPLIHSGPYDGLGLKLEADHSFGQFNKPIYLRFTATNETAQVYVIESKDLPVLDVTVTDAASKRILQSWSAEHPQQAAQRVEWQPHETKLLELTWIPTESSNQCGQYVDLRGVLSEGAKIVQSVGFTVLVCYSSPG